MSDDEVGYGKPPKATRFRKGQSGNPKGRPKTSVSLTETVQKAASKKIAIRVGDKTRRVSKLDALVDKTLNDALKGDPRARTEVLRLLKDVNLEEEAKARAREKVEDLDEDDLGVLARWQTKLSEGQGDDG